MRRVELQELHDGFYLREANVPDTYIAWLPKSDGWTRVTAEHCRQIIVDLDEPRQRAYGH